MGFCATICGMLSSAQGPHAYSIVTDTEEPIVSEDGALTGQLHLTKLARWKWWILVGINIFFLVAGQSAAVILVRFYYDQGGNSTWLAIVIQTAGFPILLIPFFLIRPSSQQSSSTHTPPIKTLIVIYVALGVFIAGDDMLYSVGLSYLSASTYSLICATQLAFNAIFSFFINSQKFTSLILNSVVVLTFSASLIAVNDDSSGPAGVSRWKYFVGFVCTVCASAMYSLLLSLMQLTFEKVIKSETFSTVLEMQIYTSLVATCVSTVGLFASGEWRTLHEEMEGFGKGSTSYVLTVVFIAVMWQVFSVGIVGLIFIVSSLFSTVISTVALAVTPIASVIVLQDKINGVKVIAMMLALWGFASYIYQNYLDDSEARKAAVDENGDGIDGSLLAAAED